MSRTKRGRKAPGKEYWSRRPGSCRDPGPDTKRETNRLERRIADRDIAKLAQEVDDD